jgi:hypothetical protein
MSLREEVEKRMPDWDRWYPSLFDAAVDLGVLRARVCAPSSLLLSNRHAAVREEAQAMHRERWGGDFSNADAIPSLEQPRRPKPKKSAAKRRKRRS